MTFRVAFVFLLFLFSLGQSGCFLSSQGPSDEEKEPHFLAGKTRLSAMDYSGAIECFEKALEANPQSASAHFQLAWLFDQKESDPAEAIHHYMHYLKLRPEAKDIDLVEQRVLTCKQELARTVSLGPVTEKVQHALEQLTEENKRLSDQNKNLQNELDKLSAAARGPQSITNKSSGALQSNRQSPAQRASLAGAPSLPEAQSSSTGSTPTEAARGRARPSRRPTPSARRAVA